MKLRGVLVNESPSVSCVRSTLDRRMASLTAICVGLPEHRPLRTV